jgi:hypothetical protein
MATLILSGRFLGFLPDHYAEAFVRAGQMRAVQPAAVSLRLPLLRHHPPLARAVAGDATAARVPGVGAHKPSGA